MAAHRQWAIERLKIFCTGKTMKTEITSTIQHAGDLLASSSVTAWVINLLERYARGCAMPLRAIRRLLCLVKDITIAVSLTIVSQAASALTDRAHLEKWCTRESSVAAGRCIGYLLAAEDILAHDSIEGIRACLPRDVTLQEQHQIVLSWLKTHPEAQSATAIGLVAKAYAEKYPCAK